MKLLAQNEEVLSYLTGNQSLISSTVESFLIKGLRQGVAIEIVFKLMYSKAVKRLLLQFENVSEYVLVHSPRSSFYNVESCKLLMTGNEYYLSLDPYDETQIIDARDNDFIIASMVKAYALNVM